MKRIPLLVFACVAMAGLVAAIPLLARAQGKDCLLEHPTFYGMAQIDGHSIFYREAGPRNAPTLLLHGFSSSSRMFERLSRGFLTATTWLRRTTRASGTVIGQIRNNSHLRSIHIAEINRTVFQCECRLHRCSIVNQRSTLAAVA